MVALYEYRWGIEDSFLVVKRVLGLAYFHGATREAIQSQVGATWIAYTLSDEVANYVRRPLETISQEMLLRGLYHFREAVRQGTSRSLIAYLAEERDLGVVIRTHSCWHPFASLLITLPLLDTS